MRNEADKLNEKPAAQADNEENKMLGDEENVQHSRRELLEEPIGKLDENQPLGEGMDFGNQNNLYGNDDYNPLG